MNGKDREYILSNEVMTVPIDTVIPYENNARVHDDHDLEILMNNIRRFKFRNSNAIQVDENMVIICGHGRLEAAKRLGMSSVPVEVIDDLTPEEVRMKRLSDNLVQDLSVFNEDLLNAELADLEMDFDIGDFGFSLDDAPSDPEPPEQQHDGGNDGGESTGTVMVYCRDAHAVDRLVDFLQENGYEYQTV